jgi:homeobox protein YOX1/YHP1
MTSSNKERYYSTVGKSRRSSPGDPHSGHGFFSGQGGRLVLPPLSDCFPTSRFSGLFSQCTVVDQPAQSHSFEPTVPVSYSNVYTQPRSAPNKLSYDLDPQALYGAYPNSNTC